MDASSSFFTPTRKLITGKPNWEKGKQYITQNLITLKNISNTSKADYAVKHFCEIICQVAETNSAKKTQ